MSAAHQTQVSESEVAELQARLAEAEETLNAIRNGEVDAIVVEGPRGRQIFTLQSADQPYRILAERMSEGAASMTADGTILFCNERLTQMVGLAPEKLVGSPVTELVVRSERERFQQLLAGGLQGEARAEVHFQRADGSLLPVLASLKALPVEPELGLCLVATDLSESKKAQETIHLQASQHATLISTTSDGYWRFDHQGKLLAVNDAYCLMSGYSREELLNMHIRDLEAVEKPEEVLAHIERVANTGFDRFESQHRKKNGELLDVEISASYFRDARQFLLFARDIGKRKRAEQALTQKASELQRSNEELSQFAHIAAHDLQEPLRKIVSFGDLLSKHGAAALDEPGRDYVLRMQNAALRMSQLIEGLLELSRLPAGGGTFQPVDLNLVLSEVLADLELRIQETHACIEAQPLPVILADRSMMRQLFQNLMDNALKFHQPNVPPVVRIRGQQREDGAWEIHISDNGIGFEEQYTDRIFRPLQRLHPKNVFQGTGMGLAICNKIVALHGGQLTARSQPGVGSDFVVTVPSVGIRAREAKAS